MRGLSSKNTRNTKQQSCSFCGNTEHQVIKCELVPLVWKQLEQGNVPLSILKAIPDCDPQFPVGDWRKNSSYHRNRLANHYSIGANWGELYKLTEKCYEKWEKAQKKTSRKGINSFQKECGFCGSKDHTRRNCTELQGYEKSLKIANRNFRKWFYQEYVEKQGLSTGCIVEMDITHSDSNSGYYSGLTHKTNVKTIVSAINWDRINLFSLITDPSSKMTWSTKVGNSGRDKLNNILAFITSPVLLKIPDNTFRSSSVVVSKRDALGDLSNNIGINLFRDRSSTLTYQKTVFAYNEQTPLTNWQTCVQSIGSINVIQKAPQNLGSEWVDGYADEMAVIFKKFNKAELDFLGILGHIKEWEKKNV